MGYSLMNNIMIVSDGNSAIHTHVSILGQTRLPSRLPCNIEQSSLCYTVIHLKCSGVYISIPDFLTIQKTNSEPLDRQGNPVKFFFFF